MPYRRPKKIPPPPQCPKPHMRPGEDRLFLKLATAIKIFLQYEITDTEIDRAAHLLYDYLVGYRDVSF